MIKSFSLEEKNISKKINNSFSLKKKKELNYTTIKYVRNPFRQEKELRQLKIFLSMKRRKLL